MQKKFRERFRIRMLMATVIFRENVHLLAIGVCGKCGYDKFWNTWKTKLLYVAISFGEIINAVINNKNHPLTPSNPPPLALTRQKTNKQLEKRKKKKERTV